LPLDEGYGSFGSASRNIDKASPATEAIPAPAKDPFVAKCPNCSHDVSTPWFFDLQRWAELRCPHCQWRLQMKPRPVVPIFVPVIFAMPLLSRYGHRFVIVGDVVLGVTALALILMLTVNIPVALRKTTTPSEPPIRLNIDQTQPPK